MLPAVGLPESARVRVRGRHRRDGAAKREDGTRRPPTARVWHRGRQFYVWDPPPCGPEGTVAPTLSASPGADGSSPRRLQGHVSVHVHGLSVLRPLDVDAT